LQPLDDQQVIVTPDLIQGDGSRVGLALPLSVIVTPDLIQGDGWT
jgi:hypothetical protein